MLNHWIEKFDRKDPEQRRIGRGAKFAVEMCLDRNIALGTCFSEEPDLLSQWRGYAQDGAGFSITFDRRRLEKAAQEFAGPTRVRLKKIAYGLHSAVETGDVIRSLHSAFGQDANTYLEDGDGGGAMTLSFNPDKHSIQREAASDLFGVKNSAFSEEREWRLMVFDSADKIGALEFRERGGTLSPFFRFAIPTEAVTGVTLGPTSSTPRTMVELALRLHGFDCWVSRSSASYRNR